MLLLLAITEFNKKEPNVSHMVKIHVACSRDMLGLPFLIATKGEMMVSDD